MITLSLTPSELRRVVGALKSLKLGPPEWELGQRLSLELSKVPRPIHNITLESSDDTTIQADAQR